MSWLSQIEAAIARSSLRRKMGYGVLAGAVAALGHAPLNLWPLTLLGLAGLYALYLSAERTRHAAWLYWAGGGGFFGVTMSWIVEPFLVDLARHGWMAPFALIFLASGLALFWAGAAAAAHSLTRHRTQVWGAAAIILCLGAAGYLRGVVFTGFPWGLPGHVLIPTPALQWASLGGATLLSLMVIALSVALIHALRGSWGLRAVWGLTLAAIMGGGAALTPPITETEGQPIVRLVQPNVPQHEKWDMSKAPDHFDRMLDLTAAPGDFDLVVWPETSIPAWLDQIPHLFPVMSRAAHGAPFVFGINRAEGPRAFNAMVVLDSKAQIAARYDKHHLVPFGEYIPLGDWLGSWGLRGLAAQDGNGFSPGPGAQLIEIPGLGRALPLICYEGVFARDIAAAPARPEVLLMITNDAWFGQVSGPYQHLAQARLRAVEQALPMIRVANTGISAMIDPGGRLIGPIPLGQAGVRDLALPKPGAPTLYSRTGDAPWAGLLGLGLLALTLGFVFNLRQVRD